jgi:N-acetylglutamate synthase-like GNAT family acetyltransferase
MVTVREVNSFDDHKGQVDSFIRRMQQDRQPDRADMANEMSKGQQGAIRFIAYAANGTVGGCMILSTHSDDLKIESIVSDPNKTVGGGVAKALVAAAVNKSFRMGKGGTLTLTNISNGTGDSFYTGMGFQYVDGAKMRMTLSKTGVWQWVNSADPVKTTRKGALHSTSLEYTPPK